jgi:ethylmalonyl-CoA/methylmalonyl-CoA decarboxylase
VNQSFAELRISNPTRKNAISGRMLFQLVQHIDELTCQKKKRVSCLALIADPAANMFCSGLDLNLAKAVVNNGHIGMEMSCMMAEALNLLRDSGIVSVAVVNGPAVGGGAELTTACDFRVMQEGSYVQFVHGKLGASPGWGGLNRLVSIVGRSKALQILGTSRKISADEALQANLIEAIIPAGRDVDAFVADYMAPYISHPYPNALRALKTAVAKSDNEALQNSKLNELFTFQDRWGGEENKSAISRT